MNKYSLIWYLKVNYLGASPRGINKKLILNFGASIGVSNPLAVPMTIASPLFQGEVDSDLPIAIGMAGRRRGALLSYTFMVFKIDDDFYIK
ncbi:hypothetical protein ACFQZJ_02795 [Maribacter chungangensis]|uniref:Uncharacterized protein n=1 Tax=Maribacter chungangensis TaxID=1069117 RepID=A0ABW3B006_9FLAO